MGRLALVLALLFVCVVGLNAHGQVEPLDELFERVDPSPVHPDFDDPIAEDSPNAVGRYLWLYETIGWRTLAAAGVVATDFTAWRVPEEHWGDLGIEAPDVHSWRAWLAENQGLIDAIVNATRLKSFDPYWHADLRAVYRTEDDPREDLRSACSRFSSVLQDDAIRLWLDGEYEASIDRMEARVRIGLQLGNGSATILQSMIAGELVERGLELVRAAYHAGITDTEADRLLTICLLIPSHDPVSIKETWYRNFEVQRQFVEQQLECVGGGDALWLRIGQQFVMREVMNHSKFTQEPGPSYAFGFVLRDGVADPPFYQLLEEGVPIKQAVFQTDDRLDETAQQTLVDAYQGAWRIAYDIYMSWDDPSTRSEATWADDFAEEDPTQIGFLMMGPVRGPWQASQDVVNARNATIATYAGADPFP